MKLLEYIHRRQLIVNAGPGMASKEAPRLMAWTVAPNPTGEPRGHGATLEEAIADLVKQEAGDDMEDIL